MHKLIGLFFGMAIWSCLAFGLDNISLITLTGDELSQGQQWNWTVSLDETDEARDVYQALDLPPQCSTTAGLYKRCYKNFTLSSGEEFSALELTVPDGSRPDSYSLTISNAVKGGLLKVPFTVTIQNQGDKAKLISILGLAQGMSLLDGRFFLSCEEGAGTGLCCSYTINSLNYYGLGRHSIALDDNGQPIYEEVFERGTEYGTDIEWGGDLTIRGDEAAALLTELGPGDPKHPDWGILIKLDEVSWFYCSKSKVSGPNCGAHLQAEWAALPYLFPDTLSISRQIPNGSPQFPANFNYTGRDGMFRVHCGASTPQVCQLDFDPLGGL